LNIIVLIQNTKVRDLWMLFFHLGSGQLEFTFLIIFL